MLYFLCNIMQCCHGNIRYGRKTFGLYQREMSRPRTAVSVGLTGRFGGGSFCGTPNGRPQSGQLLFYLDNVVQVGDVGGVDISITVDINLV